MYAQCKCSKISKKIVVEIDFHKHLGENCVINALELFDTPLTSACKLLIDFKVSMENLTVRGGGAFGAAMPTEHANLQNIVLLSCFMYLFKIAAAVTYNCASYLLVAYA